MRDQVLEDSLQQAEYAYVIEKQKKKVNKKVRQ
jgi:hypothetical protein